MLFPAGFKMRLKGGWRPSVATLTTSKFVTGDGRATTALGLIHSAGKFEGILNSLLVPEI